MINSMNNMLAAIVLAPWWLWPYFASLFFITLVQLRMRKMSVQSMVLLPVVGLYINLYMFVRYMLAAECFPEANTHFVICFGLFAVGVGAGICKELFYGQEYEIKLKSQPICFAGSSWALPMIFFMSFMGFILWEYLFSRVFTPWFYQPYGVLILYNSFILTGILLGRVYFYFGRYTQHERVS